MITFDQITLKIGDHTLLQSVSWQAERGDKAVFCGPSGCGKSSLLKTVVGAVRLMAGTVSVDGIPLSPENTAAIRTQIAYIGQEPILGAETVKEALLLPFSYKAHRNREPAEEEILQLLARLHLPPTILSKECTRISGGEKQRIAICRALLLNKTIFLTDEISSALDPESRESVLNELFQPERTLLSVSHDPAWIHACNRVVNFSEQSLKERTTP